MVLQVTEPSAFSMQSVGTTLLFLPVLLPGLSNHVSCWASSGGAATNCSPIRAAADVFRTVPIDTGSRRLPTLCMGLNSADGIVADFPEKQVELAEGVDVIAR